MANARHFGSVAFKLRNVPVPFVRAIATSPDKR
jgi:hypothetical protein